MVRWSFPLSLIVCEFVAVVVSKTKQALLIGRLNGNVTNCVLLASPVLPGLSPLNKVYVVHTTVNSMSRKIRSIVGVNYLGPVSALVAIKTV
jgi:hypothetical protein